MDIKKTIEGCLKGKRKAQRSLYELLTPVIYSAVRRYCKSEFDAEDVFQESFVRVFDNLDSFDPVKGKLESWAYKIALNSSLMFLRSSKKFQADDLDDHQHEIADSVELDQGISHEQLLQNIEKLPDGQRTVFNLYAIDGYSHKEIADMMQISESTSKSQLMKARVKLMSFHSVMEHKN